MRTQPLIAALFLLPSLCFGADFWSPINPEDVNLKTPKVQKDSAAEVLFSETKLENEFNSGHGSTVVAHYLRIKIFTDKGRDAASAEIPYAFGKTISNVAGRTIKADGQIRDLKNDAIFDKEVVRVSGLKIRAITFVLPDVAAGDIIEYRYKENWEGLIQYIRVPIQQTMPVEKAVLRVKPLSRDHTSYGMQVKVFHAPTTSFTLGQDGFSSMSFENLQAYKKEPYMPPEDEIRSWILIYYSERSDLAPAKFWTDYGHRMYAASKASMKVNEDVKRETAAIVGDATTPSEKLRRLYDFCQTKIKNSGTIEVSADERKAMKPNKSPADTLKQGMGTGSNIDSLFASLAIAAGFDARPAGSSDRSDAFFDPSFPDPYFLRTRNIAIRLNDKWTFYDPANRYVPFGMLRWQEEGVATLVGDPGDAVLVVTPLTPADASRIVRTGRFLLSEDGTLEGTVKVAYMGHEMVVRRAEQQRESIQKRKKDVEQGVTRRLPGAEVTEVDIQHPQGVEPLIYTHRVKVPGYAQRTGKRLFISPSFFEHNTVQRFPNSDRAYNLYFDFPWSVQDNIEIGIPAGYTVDHPDVPAGLDGGKIFQYHAHMQIRDKKTLAYQREMSFDSILIASKYYPQIKTLFDAQFKSDEHLITLKSDAASGGGLQPQ